MVFNTGAALLDAIVLAVVSNEKDGPSVQDHPGCTECAGGIRINAVSGAAETAEGRMSGDIRSGFCRQKPQIL